MKITYIHQQLLIEILPDIGLRIKKDALQGPFTANQTKLFIDYLLLHYCFLTESFNNLGPLLSGWMPLALGWMEVETSVCSEVPTYSPNDMNHPLHQPVPNALLGLTAFWAPDKATYDSKFFSDADCDTIHQDLLDGDPTSWVVPTDTQALCCVEGINTTEKLVLKCILFGTLFIQILVLSTRIALVWKRIIELAQNSITAISNLINTELISFRCMIKSQNWN